MSEKTEWEVVDAPSPGARSHAGRPQLTRLLREILGPHWKWKLAGVAVLAGLAVALLLAVTGVIVVTLTALALVSLAVARFRRWLRSKKDGKRDVSMRPR